jgi:hypothetical protein
VEEREKYVQFVGDSRAKSRSGGYGTVRSLVRFYLSSGIACLQECDMDYVTS